MRHRREQGVAEAGMALGPGPAADAGGPLGAAHRRRLRDLWRSAGWPCHDAIELDLLAAAIVAMEMQRDGRIVWRGLSLRAPVPRDDGGTTWSVAMPDVYSIRHTTREDQVEPIAHDIKVSRADLLSDHPG